MTKTYIFRLKNYILPAAIALAATAAMLALLYMIGSALMQNYLDNGIYDIDASNYVVQLNNDSNTVFAVSDNKKNDKKNTDSKDERKKPVHLPKSNFAACVKAGSVALRYTSPFDIPKLARMITSEESGNNEVLQLFSKMSEKDRMQIRRLCMSMLGADAKY